MFGESWGRAMSSNERFSADMIMIIMILTLLRKENHQRRFPSEPNLTYPDKELKLIQFFFLT